MIYFEFINSYYSIKLIKIYPQDPYAYQGQPSSFAPTYLYPAITPVYVPVVMQPTTMMNSYKSVSSKTGELLTGRIKFFDEGQQYGFFILDCDGSDLFVHYDDLLKAGLTKDTIPIAKVRNLKFQFRCVSYYGKYNLSYKAADILLLPGQLC